MKRRILVVAEDASLRAMLARALLQAGQAVELAEGARRAREVIAQDDVALAIVAPHGMGAAGVALAIEIKRQVHRLILITEPDEAVSSDLPEAARLSRPFNEQELLARVKVAALQDNRYSWRTVERLAIEAGVEETKAHEILAEHADEIVLGKSHEGKLIARLSAR